VIRRLLELYVESAEIGEADSREVAVELVGRCRPAVVVLEIAMPLQEGLDTAFFTSEYSVEAAALCNPSMVRAPGKDGLPPGQVRFVMSLRRTGKGHIASYGLGRVCAVSGCATQLSRYNSGSVCWLHDMVVMSTSHWTRRRPSGRLDKAQQFTPPVRRAESGLDIDEPIHRQGVVPPRARRCGDLRGRLVVSHDGDTKTGRPIVAAQSAGQDAGEVVDCTRQVVGK
jgi:hypothetical protein